MAGITEKRKTNESITDQGTAKKQKTCRCGSTTHQQTTYRECPLNKLAVKPTLIPLTPAMVTMALPPSQAMVTETVPPTTPAIPTTAPQALAAPTTVVPPEETQAMPSPLKGTLVMATPMAPIAMPPRHKGTMVKAMPIPPAVLPPTQMAIATAKDKGENRHHKKNETADNR
jgi:hypothetical protein